MYKEHVLTPRYVRHMITFPVGSLTSHGFITYYHFFGNDIGDFGERWWRVLISGVNPAPLLMISICRWCKCAWYSMIWNTPHQHCPAKPKGSNSDCQVSSYCLLALQTTVVSVWYKTLKNHAYYVLAVFTDLLPGLWLFLTVCGCVNVAGRRQSPFIRGPKSQQRRIRPESRHRYVRLWLITGAALVNLIKVIFQSNRVSVLERCLSDDSIYLSMRNRKQLALPINLHGICDIVLMLGQTSKLANFSSRRRWPSVELMLGRRLRRRPNINSTLGECLVFAGHF